MVLEHTGCRQMVRPAYKEVHVQYTGLLVCWTVCTASHKWHNMGTGWQSSVQVSSVLTLCGHCIPQ